MPSILLKDIPEEIHAQLAREAQAHHRSLPGEALRRIELSFDVEDALTSRRDAAWVKEALQSGPQEVLTRKRFQAAVRRGLQRAASGRKAS